LLKINWLKDFRWLFTGLRLASVARAGALFVPRPFCAATFGGAVTGVRGGRADGGRENADQKQLDRELASAVGREDWPGLPDQQDAGGRVQAEEGNLAGATVTIRR
jgi:hypothetical protein